ncbi:TPA: hypothetical protein EYN09_23025 [Candidatus Poribacteria bacterium]|nr:hypothetical protein [Candidatus Poribacteria bacterium]
MMELQGDSANKPRIQRSLIDKIKHVEQCIKEKGYLDKTSDKKGKRPEWDRWIQFLLEKGYLLPHTVETKTKPKTVYRLGKSVT